VNALPVAACCFLAGTLTVSIFHRLRQEGANPATNSHVPEKRNQGLPAGGEPTGALHATLVPMEAQERTAAAPQGAVEQQPLRVLMPSPLGTLGVEMRGTTVTRVLIEPSERERETFSTLHEVDGSDFLDEVFGRLSEYFAGARRKLELEYDLGPCGLDSFTRRVLKETAKIPYGKTRTYQEIAEATGWPDAGREVLSALLGNPIPILVPCHRVIDGTASPGAYAGGSERKIWLLEMERQAAATF
jgi:methylated-DNA-[protein]-cysteine S-methyltransferase